MTTPEDFAGRVALVTGAASGIGAAVATRLAADGAHVAVADNDCLGAERTVRLIREAGGRAEPVAADVTDPASVEAAAKTTAATCPQQVAYATVKHGVVGLTKSAALEYTSQRIRVNAVAPGFVETPLLTEGLTPLSRRTLVRAHPIGQLGDAAEVASWSRSCSRTLPPSSPAVTTSWTAATRHTEAAVTATG